MSSGSTLLQQLRHQSKSSCTSPSQNSHKSIEADENTKNITSSSRDAAIIEQTGPSAVGASITHKEADAINTMSKKKKKMIEVCLGPDCAVAGGGAALLEIEDLLHKCTIKGEIATVRAGGCRDQCTEGPNVRILSVNSDNTAAAGGRRNIEEEEVDFHRVNCPEACRRVMDSLLCTASSISTEARQTDDEGCKASSENIIVARLLSRKEDARRWKTLRERAAKERRLQSISRKI
jgi:hypothetical protein